MRSHDPRNGPSRRQPRPGIERLEARELLSTAAARPSNPPPFFDPKLIPQFVQPALRTQFADADAADPGGNPPRNAHRAVRRQLYRRPAAVLRSA